MEVSKVRDLTLIEIDESKIMVIACDSCVSIGMKPGDELKVPPSVSGKFTARVCIMEVLCSGAEVVTVADAICNEMKTTGEEIIAGIKEELLSANIKDIALTGSTEENFATSMTAVGITVIGITSGEKIRVNNVKENSMVVSIGIPKVGSEINFYGDEEIFQYEQLNILLNTEGVLEIVPVGSKGILYEVNQIATCNNMKFIQNDNIKIDINKSGGPSTVAVAAVTKQAFEKIKTLKNLNILGNLI